MMTKWKIDYHLNCVVFISYELMEVYSIYSDKRWGPPLPIIIMAGAGVYVCVCGAGGGGKPLVLYLQLLLFYIK